MLYFIAIVAPGIINNQVQEWKHYMLQKFNCKVALKSPAHITLIPPFDMPGTMHHELEEVLLQFAAGQLRFPIQLKNFAAFEPRVIYVHVQPNIYLSGLQARLEAYLLRTDFPIKKEDRPYHPHVTIANRDLQAADFPRAWQHFQQLSFETSFVADTISLLRHNGQIWEVVNSFPLGN